MTQLDRFLEACADDIDRRVALGPESDRLKVGARAFRDAIAAAEQRLGAVELSDVPVTACLDQLAEKPLVPRFLSARGEISWIPSHRTSDGGTERALAPLNDVRDFGGLICGLMLLGSGQSYPEHAHAPHEIYLPLSGAGRWLYGGNPSYRKLADDALVYNPPRALHGACAGTDPLLALYVLWD
jgi:hypothetical protein